MEFYDDLHKDLSISFYRLKNNEGFFKSIKQRDFFKRYAIDTNYKNFKVPDGCYTVVIGGTVRYADYGTRSVRRIEWIYVLDAFGIVSQYRIKFNYSSDGRYSEPSGEYEHIWERSKDAKLPKFEEPVIRISDYVGDIGKRLSFDCLVKRVSYLGYDSFNNPRYQTILETAEGNVLVYWNVIKLKDVDRELREGDRVKFSAGIKAFEQFKGVKQTFLTRVTKANLVS